MPMEWLSELTGNTISLTVERDMRQTQVLASGTAVYKNKKKIVQVKKHLLIQVLLDVDVSVIHENMIKAEPDSQGYAQSVVWI